MNQIELVKNVARIKRLVKIVNKECDGEPIQVEPKGTKFRLLAKGIEVEATSAEKVKTTLTNLSMFWKLKRRAELALDLGMEVYICPTDGERELARFLVYVEVGETKLMATSGDTKSLSYKEAIALTRQIKKAVVELAMEEAKEATTQ